MFSALNFWDLFNWNGWIEGSFFPLKMVGFTGGLDVPLTITRRYWCINQHVAYQHWTLNSLTLIKNSIYVCVCSFCNFSPSEIWPESFSPWLRFGLSEFVCMNSYVVHFPSVKISMTPRRWILMDGFGWVGFNVEVSNCQMVQNKPQLKHFKR